MEASKSIGGLIRKGLNMMHDPSTIRIAQRIAMTPEQEWRAHLLAEIKEIRSDVASVKSEMTTLKVKVALFASIISSIATLIAERFIK